MFSFLAVTERYCFSSLVIFKRWFVLLLYWIAFTVIGPSTYESSILVFLPVQSSKEIWTLVHFYSLVCSVGEQAPNLFLNKDDSLWFWWYFKTEDVSKCACVSFFPFMHTLAGFSQSKNGAHWWLSVEVSSSEPGVRAEYGPVIVSVARENRDDPQW